MAVEELYCNLNKLLEDICKFLADESNYKNLSPGARKHADELINRSKNQLHEIAKVTNDCDGAYVDMEKKSVGSNEDDNDNIYSSVDEVILSNSTVAQPQQDSYTNLPAKELDQNLKHGSLSWRCRIILNIKKMKQVFAGVHNNWLLLYSSEKDIKPLQTFNLQYHKAQDIPCKQGKNLSLEFELINTVEEKKSYYFVASTHKDMLQWVAQINKCYDSFNNADDDDLSETYDVITTIKKESKISDDDESGEAIYYPIEEVSSNYKPEKKNQPPELPSRRIPKSPLPILPPVVKENKEKYTASLSSSNDTIKSTESLKSSSFSEEDEDDDIYEPFVLKKPVKKIVSNTPERKNLNTPEKKIVNTPEQKNVNTPETKSVNTPDTKSVDNSTQDNRQKNEENVNISRKNSIQGKQKPDTPVKPKFLEGKPKPFKKIP